MSPKERRAYRLGFLCAMRKMRRELDEMVKRVDDELVELMDETRDMKNEYYRLKAVEEAVAAERNPNELLN